ncbi:MAG: ABC-F family ATPase [Candidatus Marinimicrobia bacterium]|nr:ABC-F family ATPase [Candidatus Neomarinimicrobiota bacterium]MBT3501685.1 ABC-F family ATPase [Candidatus Neomarinimicrobiota bacterium]MBT3839863.1 ABC-F family ATPase [Candidatus Neomarinimicrobiota bacterium]MBT3998451.1 ABC-F family ATPase [Candidatus Neomarinimicrobiota bacterium]MBT4282229.1 ABC-F family ATPase [Candidatus Neomarinimicrobiota bacterium]
MISTTNISIQFGSTALFEDINVTFSKGNRYGLIGANGSGKSTFLKILSGDLEPSSGNVKVDMKQRLSVLAQDQFAYEDINVIDCVIMGHKELWKIKKERDRIYSLPEMSEEDGMKVADLEVEFSDMDGYMAESNAGDLLLGVGIPLEQHEEPMRSLAPGLKLRVLLTQALFGDPGILLLDEPTNNLDINTIRWLEDILKSRNSTMIIISHDRHFLNSVCTHMADIDYGEIRQYPGNYDDFMLASTQAREQLLNENAKKKAKIDELQSFVKRFSANASKAKQATSRANQIDKIKLNDIKKSSRVYPFIRFSQEKKIFNTALLVEGLTKTFDNLTVLNKLNFTIDAGERLAIIGANGIGKTTLLRNLVNDLTPDSGTIKWSENSVIGYFAQNHGNDFNSNLSLIDWMNQWRQQGDDLQTIRGTLGRLLFSQDDINKPVNVLSGGEQRRMLFGKIILQRPNVIIMDEPTNHLDMESIESLNSALSTFEGTLIFVSHDREFVSSLATRIIELKQNKCIEYGNNYDSYLHSIGAE